MTAEPDDHVLALRAAVLKLKEPEVSKRAPTPTSSVYGRAAAAVPDDVKPSSTREALEARFRNVETTALMAGTTMALIVLPDPGEIPPQLMRSLEMLVAAQAVVVVLGPEIPRQVDPTRVITLPLRHDDHLGNEWAVLALSPQKRVAFLARRHDAGWDWILTRDAVAVHRAGTAILERVPFLRLRVPALED